MLISIKRQRRQAINKRAQVDVIYTKIYVSVYFSLASCLCLFLPNTTSAQKFHQLSSEIKKMQFPKVRWKKLTTQKGITVFQGQRSDSVLPLLKGQGQLNLNLYEIMAVVEDAKQHPKWVYRMSHSIIFERPDPFNLKAYVRFDFPWPASNRDSVLQVQVVRSWVPHHEVWIYFHKITHPKYPQNDECVRVIQSRGYTRLRWISPTQTEVIYLIDSDPGGDLPKWLVRWIAKDLPLKVILSLNQRVKNTRGKYELFLNRWDPRRTPQTDAPSHYILPGVP